MKLSKKQRRAAKRLPAYLRDFAARKTKQPRLKGSFGPAGPVKIITPGGRA